MGTTMSPYGEPFLAILLSRIGLMISVLVLPISDAVHCKDGCSALRERLQCTASEMGKTGTEIVSPILDQRKGIVAVRKENDVSASGYLVRTFLPLMTETPL